jgi:hypothetical protein
MSKKTDYVDQAITNKILEKKDGYEKFQNKEAITFFAFVICGVIALPGIVFSPSIALSFGSIAALLGCHKYIKGKEYFRKEDRLEQEINHLQKIRNEKTLTTKEQYEKACNKVIAISNSQIKAEKDYDNAVTLRGLTYAITAIGAVSAFINPWTAWVPAIGIISNILAGKNEIKKHDKKVLLENRINNLLSDLDASTLDYTPKSIKEAIRENNRSYKMENTKEKNKEKVYVKSRD